MGVVQGGRSRWDIAERAPGAFFEALKAHGVHPAVAQSLFVRGLKTPDAAHQFLATDGERPRDAEPTLLRDLPKAVDRLARALREGETVGVFADYDADGVNSAAILDQGLRLLGARPVVHLPNRFTDGYGLSTRGLDYLKQQGVSLVVSADCGVTGHAMVDYATSRGLDVIVTDHHLPAASLPNALAVIDPHRPDCPYPHKELCGAGVAFKLLQGLADSVDPRGRVLADELLDLLALATIADVASLRGENRYLVRAGLRALNEHPRVGILALVRAAGVTPGKVTDEDLGFRLAPRINAAGRLDDPRLAYDLLVCDDPARADELAARLSALNTRRQQLTEDILTAAAPEVERQLAQGRYSLVVGGEDWPRGVLGLAAGRLAETHGRPTLIFTRHDDRVHGSGRSNAALHIMEALGECADLLLGFGGHRQACGFSLLAEHVPALVERFEAACRGRLTPADLTRRLAVDGYVPFDRLDAQMQAAVAQLSPFGQDFPEPVFATQGVTLVESRVVGRGHWRVVAEARGHRLGGIGFGLGDLAARFPSGSRACLAYRLALSEWQGEVRTELRLLDAAPIA